MSGRDLSISDFDALMETHSRRTAALRALHPLHRPALDTSERDSELRVAMAAVALVCLLATFSVLAGIGTLVFVAYGWLRPLAPVAAAAARRLIEQMSPDVATLVSAGLVLLGLALFSILWPRHSA